MRAPSMSALRAFCAAADLGSFRRAAERLNVTESAVSHQIRALEQSLGRQLFERAPSGLKLTIEGVRYNEMVHGAVDSIIAATDAVSASEPPGRVRLTLPSTFGAHWLFPCLGLLPERPSLGPLRLVPSDQILDLRRDDIELAIRHLPADAQLADQDTLHVETAFPVTAPERAGEVESVEELLGRRDLLLNDAHPNEWRRFAARFGLPEPARPPALSLTGSDMVLEAAAAGLGVALGRTPIVTRRLRQGALAAPLGAEHPTGWVYALILRDGVGSRPAVLRIRDLLLSLSALDAATP